MLNKLVSFCREQGLILSGDRIVCAVSGGADSMALLWAMYLLRDKLGITLECAHFNHQLRGEESDRDAAFVRQFCEDYHIPFHYGTEKVAAGEKGLEAAARDARYRFFKDLPGKIATAHTADDNAETMLMHLIRGTGLKGLGGIAPKNGNIIRPMLTVTREDVLAFIGGYSLSYVNDSTNGEDAFLRNRLRHHVMPLLREENPRICENLSAMALRLREDEAYLSVQTEGAKTTNVSALQNQPDALRLRVLARLLEGWGVPEPEAEHIALADKLVFSDKPSAKAAFPGGVTVSRNYKTLEKAGEDTPITAVELPCPGEVEFPQINLRITCAPAKDLCKDRDRFTVATEGNIIIRSRNSGDKLRRSSGSKSLKELFIDSKIPASQRSLIPVLADEKGIIAVYGFGADTDRLAETLPAVEIRFENI